MNIRCPRHRILPWLGHGVCLSCDKVYKHILSAPNDCSCGAPLLPRTKLVAEVLMRSFGETADARSFFGRPICSKCAECLQVGDGIVPA